MKVLIAVDVSGAAETMLDTITRRHWPEPCEFNIVTVVERTTGRFASDIEMNDDEIAVCKQIARDRMNGFMSTVARKVPHATVHGDVLVGGAAEVIVKKAVELDVDLIVIGHQGTYGQGGYSLGGVADRVVQHAPCSVIVVKPKVRVMQGASV
jgi:nucleotide-binding universal stress UspA family protein